MFRFVHTLLGVGVGALILVAGASSRSSDDQSTPPILQSPAPGYSFTSGTPIVFQIQTFPGDYYLWLHVSRSPVPVDPCGTIGDEVEIESFSSISDSSIYQAAPTYFEGDWMDTPGTYYWQAYRISYAGDPDGCVESEVRSLTITKAVVVKPPPRSLSAARLEGDFKIKLAVRETYGIGNRRRGRTYSEGWTFAPRCSSGPCHTKASASSFDPTIGWSLVLKRSGALYKKKSQRATLGKCSSKPISGPLSISVKVTKGGWIGTEWRAMKITGTFRHSFGSTVSGIYHCPAGMISATLRGTFSE